MQTVYCYQNSEERGENLIEAAWELSYSWDEGDSPSYDYPGEPAHAEDIELGDLHLAVSCPNLPDWDGNYRIHKGSILWHILTHHDPLGSEAAYRTAQEDIAEAEGEYWESMKYQC